MNKVYSGFGHREISENAYRILFNVAEMAANSGYTLRSGGALGADTAFEKGSLKARVMPEIYLPWKGSNGHTSPFYSIPDKAFDIASGHHPYWGKLTQGVRKLMARNVQILLGEKLDKPSDFGLCWADSNSGGTRFTMRLADSFGIPVYNLAESSVHELIQILGIKEVIGE